MLGLDSQKPPCADSLIGFAGTHFDGVHPWPEYDVETKAMLGAMFGKSL
jgi:hypothetical protein